ncbi:MAG: VWA domain-containing protein, partial [Desulfobacterales bacterium]|nr:VWA domain-containing protein [Desulfobacterales bacterium]
MSSVGGPEGWIRKDRASDWKQALTLVFTERTGRRPVLFFESLDALEKIAATEDPGAAAEQVSTRFSEIRDGKLDRPKDFPASAMEPGEQAVSRDRFYLIPIFQAMEIFEGVKFLEVASIDPGAGWTMNGQAELRTAIVFAIDTTISMKPYIHRTREAVRKIYDAIQSAGLAEKVAFGLVAFRSSVVRTPGLEYVSEVVSPFRDGSRRDDFETALAGVKEAEVSSHS